MTRSRVASFVIVFLCGASTAVSAQERGRVGLVMTYPVSAGVLWQAADRIALRPFVDFSASANESEQDPPFPSMFATTTESSGDSTTVGAAVIVYLDPPAALRTYVAPQVSYGRTSIDIGGSQSETDIDTWLASGLYGVEYAVAPRFTVFGEIGVGYTRSTGTFRSMLLGTTITTESRDHSVGMRGGVGIVLYF